LKKSVFGIFGQIELATGPYLILIESATLVGMLLRSHVYRVDELLFVPINNAKVPLKVAPQDQQFVDMI